MAVGEGVSWLLVLLEPKSADNLVGFSSLTRVEEVVEDVRETLSIVANYRVSLGRKRCVW